MTKIYKPIIDHYEKCLETHGDNNLGVDWPNLSDVDKRYRVMLDVEKYSVTTATNKKDYTLLDFGCGAGHLLEFIMRNNINKFSYTGLDISEKFIDLCRNKFQKTSFLCMDLMATPYQLSNFDYIIMNGVFTEKRELSFNQMWDYFKDMLRLIFRNCDMGLAFNVMSKHVDWERNDLFHLPHDLLADFLTKEISRNFIIRNDYGLYEYTVYVYK